MAAATDQQVQNYVDQRIRPLAERVRSLKSFLDDSIATIDDIYAALSQPTPTWEDKHSSNPPHLLTPQDVLAFNTFMNDLKNAIQNNPQYPIVTKACVQPIG